jgi:hypothetical protein
MKKIKWIGPPTHCDFGRIETGQEVNVGALSPWPYVLEFVAQRWVAQGMAEWVPDAPTSLGPPDMADPTCLHLNWSDKKRKVKGPKAQEG